MNTQKRRLTQFAACARHTIHNAEESMRKYFLLGAAAIGFSSGCSRPWSSAPRATSLPKVPWIARITDFCPVSPIAGPLKPVVVENGNANRVAVVDVDGLILNTPFVGPMSLGENPVALFRGARRLSRAIRASAGSCSGSTAPAAGSPRAWRCGANSRGSRAAPASRRRLHARYRGRRLLLPRVGPNRSSPNRPASPAASP